MYAGGPPLLYISHKIPEQTTQHQHQQTRDLVEDKGL